MNSIYLAAAAILLILVSAPLPGSADGDTGGTILADAAGLAGSGASADGQEHGEGQSAFPELIADPRAGYVLLLLGFYGVFFELVSPGALFPGIAGGICLVLAFTSFQSMPFNPAGLALIVGAVLFFILELKILSYGLLTLGGIIAMAAGSLMLYDTDGSTFRLPLSIIIPAVLVTALFFIIIGRLAYRAHKQKPLTGREGLIGLEGHVMETVTKKGGMVSLHGEFWSALSDDDIEPGSPVIVTDLAGLRLKVRKKEKENPC